MKKFEQWCPKEFCQNGTCEYNLKNNPHPENIHKVSMDIPKYCPLRAEKRKERDERLYKIHRKAKKL